MTVPGAMSLLSKKAKVLGFFFPPETSCRLLLIHTGQNYISWLLGKCLLNGRSVQKASMTN